MIILQEIFNLINLLLIMFQIDTKLQSDNIFINKLAISQLFLSNDSNYPWFVLIPEIEGKITEIIDLSFDNQKILLKEINFISQFLLKNFRPDKLNIANLGNVVSQLHIHIIARFKNDPAFPRPIWGIGDKILYQKNDSDIIIAKTNKFISENRWFIDDDVDDITMQSLVKQLKYRSNYRGCKETDFLIGKFANENIANFDRLQLLNFALFLSEDDAEIYDWIIGKSDIIKQYQDIIAKIRIFHNLNS